MITPPLPPRTVIRAWTSVSAPQAHALYVTANPMPSAKVCFLDSGIWGGHPDLGPNIDQTVGYNAITRQSGFAAQKDDW